MFLKKESTPLTVSQLTLGIKRILENEYKFVRILGEISNLTTPFSGHSYFTLKDEKAQIRAILFKQQKRFVSLRLENGQKVVCFGRVSVYEPRGDYQIILDSVELYGTGRLQLEFEALKAELAARGYFDESMKKQLPLLPKHIAVITSATSAALQDFLKTIRNQKAPLHILVIPVPVQGKEAPEAIREAFASLSDRPEIETVVLCRGGGSIEDLQPFNTETVAEAIHSCPLPTITGIGHETDYTIADFCADERAATPTAAAEMLCSKVLSLKQHIDQLNKRLRRNMELQLSLQSTRLMHSTRHLKNQGSRLQVVEQRLLLSTSSLHQAMLSYLQRQTDRLDLRRSKMEMQSPLRKITLQKNHLAQLSKTLEKYMLDKLSSCEETLQSRAAILHSVSPLATLARGYSIVRKKEKKKTAPTVIKSSTQVYQGDRLNILLSEGELDCEVVKKL
ncbi:MAG: exodeoxyribonuclease VII large subunit [Deltaproteobacteria bacterium]|nr:MAG: exodeoxyribonuclease VII large subunit [Deltaproteobacteria bacterium]